jgi:hypothetical protein
MTSSPARFLLGAATAALLIAAAASGMAVRRQRAVEHDLRAFLGEARQAVAQPEVVTSFAVEAGVPRGEARRTVEGERRQLDGAEAARLAAAFLDAGRYGRAEDACVEAGRRTAYEFVRGDRRVTFSVSVVCRQISLMHDGRTVTRRFDAKSIGLVLR